MLIIDGGRDTGSSACQCGSLMSRSPVRDTRHILVARALHARLYVNREGRIFAWRGRVSYETLRQALVCHDRCPTCEEAPTPRDFGLATSDGELSRPLLHQMGRALQRWRYELAAEMRCKPARRRATTTLAREQQELERLTVRLAAVRKWQALLAEGNVPSGAPFFLDPEAEATFHAALANARRSHALTPLMVWQARVVRWLSGDCALRRFLSAVTRLLLAYPQVSRREWIRSFQRALFVWKQRGEREPVRHLLAEMSRHIRRLPADVVRSARCSARLRGRTFQRHCDFLLEHCERLLKEGEFHRARALPAALAALAAADGGMVDLPDRYIRTAAAAENFPWILASLELLAKQIGQPGYNALLVALDELPESAQGISVDQLRLYLARGNSLADCIWACERELVHGLRYSHLNIRSARRLSNAFAERGCPLSNDDLADLVRRITSQTDLRPIQAWLGWLGSVSPATITPRMRRILRAALWDRYLPSVLTQGWFKQVAPCLETAPRTKGKHEFAPLLARIAAFQQAADKKAALPKSLRKLFEVRDRREGEREVLRQRQATVGLDPAARARWQQLERDTDVAPDAAKLRRAAEEAWLLLGVERLTAVTGNLADATCRTHLADMATLLSPDQRWRFALWMGTMSEADRDRLQRLVQARQSHGREYKRHLAENQDWLGRAAVRGIDVGPWFDDAAQVEFMADQRLEIGLSSDLHQIFLMGTYFKTCLSLGDFNEMSVLSNAGDANKQVVFMFGEDDAGRKHVIARQLIAISEDFKLLGYCCYVSSRCAGQENRQHVVNLMAAYCARLAARCGLELADEGTPISIRDYFWYDDGPREWPAAARAAWAECLGTREKELAAC